MSSKGRVTLGYGNGSSYTPQGDISGPITDQLKYRASVATTTLTVSSKTNSSAPRPTRYATLPVACACCGSRTIVFTGDLRASYSKIDTKALYFVIPRADEANVFSIVSDANNDQHTDHARQPRDQRA